MDVQQMTCPSIRFPGRMTCPFIRSPCSNPRFCQGLSLDEAIGLPLQMRAQPIGKESVVPGLCPVRCGVFLVPETFWDGWRGTESMTCPSIGHAGIGHAGGSGCDGSRRRGAWLSEGGGDGVDGQPMTCPSIRLSLYPVAADVSAGERGDPERRRKMTVEV